MGTTSLKLNASDAGDLKEITTTEENYLAYRAGLNLAAGATTTVSALNVDASGATVGAYTDTAYDQAVGTHGTTLTQSTTSTTLYQREGTAGEGANFRWPLEFDSSSDNLHEMTDAEVSTLTDRLVSRIFTSDYPGVYKLGTTAPSGDYDTHISNLFTDTRADGTSINFSIFQRQTMSAPTAIRPVAIKRSSGKTGTYQGVQEMSDTQITDTFGPRARTRIMSGSNGVGTYLLLSATDGTPTANSYSGTWASKGVATDTTQTVSDTSYTRLSTGNYARIFTGNYSRDFAGNYSRNFLGNYNRIFAGNYTRIFAGNYARIFAGNYVPNFIGNYSRDFAGNYTRAFTRVSTRTRNSAYTRTSTRTRASAYTRISTRTRASAYTRLRIQNRSSAYTRTSTRTSSRAYTRTRVTNYTGDYTRAFLGNYTGNYSRAFTRLRLTNYTGDYTRLSTRTSTRSSVVAYTRLRLTNYTGNYTRLRLTNYTGNYSRGFLGNYARAFTRTSTRTSTGSASYARNLYYGRIVNYNGSGAYGADQYSTTAPAYAWTVLGAIRIIQWGGSLITNNDTNINSTTYDAGSYTYQRRGLVSGYVDKLLGPVNYYKLRRKLDSVNYARIASYSRIGNYARTLYYAGNFLGNYARAYTRNRIASYTRISTGNFLGNYTRISVGNFLGNYSRGYAGTLQETS